MDAAAPTSVPDSGRLIAGRFRVGEVIGEGGMGVVLAATDERTGTAVALKVLKALAEEDIERFLREARLASRIDSEHVVRVLEMGMLERHPFIAMERLVGEDYAV